MPPLGWGHLCQERHNRRPQGRPCQQLLLVPGTPRICIHQGKVEPGQSPAAPTESKVTNPSLLSCRNSEAKQPLVSLKSLKALFGVFFDVWPSHPCCGSCYLPRSGIIPSGLPPHRSQHPSRKTSWISAPGMAGLEMACPQKQERIPLLLALPRAPQSPGALGAHRWHPQLTPGWNSGIKVGQCQSWKVEFHIYLYPQPRNSLQSMLESHLIAK